MSDRWRSVCLAIVASVSFVSTSRADSAVITSGSINFFWDGSLSGIELFGDGTHLIAEHMTTPPQSFQAGQIADLSSGVVTSASHPVDAAINGTTHSSVWVKGRFDESVDAGAVGESRHRQRGCEPRRMGPVTDDHTIVPT
jgi:hypothetical protein